ncbi:hypothetical protein FB451DRAFT_1389402 [Mycena latifolia]|nr:hypothetical protein FB451DRAFT_1389402 [Mycena latifolia]
MQDSRYQLTATIILGSLSLTPNNTLRYAALGIGLGAIYAIYLKRSSTLPHQLEETLNATDALIRRAKSLCPRDQISLAEESLRLLQVTHCTSLINSRILETQRFTWKTYRQLSKEMARVKCIRTAVELIVEAERQRRLAEKIGEAQFILCTVIGGHWGIADRFSPYRRQLNRSYWRPSNADNASV